MNKKIVLFVIICCSLLMIVGCSKDKAISDNPLSKVEDENINSIIIRTQMTEGQPEEKQISDKNDIKKVLEYLNNVNYKVTKQPEERENGWGFWIIADSFEVLLLKDRVYINNKLYLVDVNISEEFLNTYNELITPSKPYP